MELISVLLIFVFGLCGFYGLKWLLATGRRPGRSAARAAVGRDWFSEFNKARALVVAFFRGRKVKATVGGETAVEKGGPSNGAGIEELLGIEAGWGKDRKKRHLRSEFSKLNSRLNVLPSGTERENAQRMLGLQLLWKLRRGHLCRLWQHTR